MEIKLKHVPWCDSCRKPLELKVAGDWAVWYCHTVNCKEQGGQVRIATNRLNGTIKAAKAKEYL